MANLPVRSESRGGMARRQQQHPVDQFRQQMDSLFNQFFGGFPTLFDEGGGQSLGWDFGVTQDDKEITVRAELPGFDENELDVRLDNDVLTIQAEKENKGDGQEEYRSFYRSMTLPSGIEADKVRASYKNGVLELHMARPEGSRSKRIAIQGQLGSGQRSISEKSGSGGNVSPAGQPGAKEAGKKTTETARTSA